MSCVYLLPSFDFHQQAHMHHFLESNNILKSLEIKRYKKKLRKQKHPIFAPPFMVMNLCIHWRDVDLSVKK